MTAKKRTPKKKTKEEVLTSRRRLSFHTVVSVPFGLGQVTLEVELNDWQNRFRPRHSRLVFRTNHGERLMSGPCDLIEFAKFLGISLESQIERNPNNFAALYTACITNAQVLWDPWLTDLRTKVPALAHTKEPHVQDHALCYFLVLFDAEQEGYSIIEAKLDTRSLLLTTRVLWHNLDDQNDQLS